MSATIALFLIAEPLAARSSNRSYTARILVFLPRNNCVATIFWTLISGAPSDSHHAILTLCLVVLGNHVPGALSMLTALLGDQPALTPSERRHQRLLVGDVAESESLAEEEIEKAGLLGFYQDVAIPSLGLAQADARDGTVPVNYLSRVWASMQELADDLDDHDLAADKPGFSRRNATPRDLPLAHAAGWTKPAPTRFSAHVLRKSGINAAVLARQHVCRGKPDISNT